jgi:hypothetical protein
MIMSMLFLTPKKLLTLYENFASGWTLLVLRQ